MAVLALVTGTVVAGLVQRAAEARDRYGRVRPVLVATARLEPGDRLDAGRTEVRRLPADLVPSGALTSLPADRTVTAVVAEGEAVLGERVGRAGRPGPQALMPEGSRALAVPVPVRGLPVHPGDHVDLLAAAPDGGHPGVVARDGVVIAVDDDSTTVAVGAGDAPDVAEALGGGSVVIALRPG